MRTRTLVLGKLRASRNHERRDSTSLPAAPCQDVQDARPFFQFACASGRWPVELSQCIAANVVHVLCGSADARIQAAAARHPKLQLGILASEGKSKCPSHTVLPHGHDGHLRDGAGPCRRMMKRASRALGLSESANGPWLGTWPFCALRLCCRFSVWPVSWCGPMRSPSELG